ncbi:MAG: hypothetical protein JXA54_05325 [Candidatus Heimdallarchaeota archaeon]|nr:hypothetical protein [Candidatus Heimdallarchaeota archaeon]
MSNTFIYFLEQSWLFVFLISIIFIFIIVFRDLGQYTRKIKRWSRISYYKTLPRVVMTFQHFSRRGELLSITNLGMCQSIRTELITLFKAKKGYSEFEMNVLLDNKEKLSNIFNDENLVKFLFDVNTWYIEIEPKEKFFDRLFKKFRQFFSEEREADIQFFIELALVIRTFRKALEA